MNELAVSVQYHNYIYGSQVQCVCDTNPEVPLMRSTLPRGLCALMSSLELEYGSYISKVMVDTKNMNSKSWVSVKGALKQHEDVWVDAINHRLPVSHMIYDSQTEF